MRLDVLVDPIVEESGAPPDEVPEGEVDNETMILSWPPWLERRRGSARLAYSENQPRDERGRFGEGDGGAPVGTGTKDDPVHVSSAAEAQKLIGEGKFVEMPSDQVSVLLERLAAVARDAQSRGEKAPLYDLCKVSVADTNMFCGGTRDIPRIEMPQLVGTATPGTPADALPKDAKGETDITGALRAQLTADGVGFDNISVPADTLRATQNELNGAKVAGMMDAIRVGTLPPDRIFVSRDNYVVDGHHRWAAEVGTGFVIGQALSMDVTRVDMPIAELIPYVNGFSASLGMEQRSASVRQAYSPDQERDEHGRFGPGGGNREMFPKSSVPLGPAARFNFHDLPLGSRPGMPFTGARLEQVQREVPGLKERMDSVRYSGERIAGALPNADVHVEYYTDPQLIGQVADRVEVFAQEFPNAAATVTGFSTSPGLADGVIAEVGGHVVEGGHLLDTKTSEVFLNEHYYGGYVEPPKFADLCARMADRDLHPLGTPESIIDHELGHVLDNATGWNGSAAMLMVSSGRSDEARFDAWRPISIYATVGPKEAFAEAFSARSDPAVYAALPQTVRDVVESAIANEHALPRQSAVMSLPSIRHDGDCTDYVPSSMIPSEVKNAKPRQAYSEDQARDEQGRFGEGGGNTGPSTRELVSLTRNEGGLTYSLTEHSLIHEGVSVSAYPDREVVVASAAELTVEHIEAFEQANSDLLSQPDHYLGTWLNPDDGHVYLDVSIVVATREQADVIGREHGQFASFNLATGDTYPIDSGRAPQAASLEEASGRASAQGLDPGAEAGAGGRHQGRSGPAPTQVARALARLSTLRANLGRKLLAGAEVAYADALRRAGVKVATRARSRGTGTTVRAQVAAVLLAGDPLRPLLGALGLREQDILAGAFTSYEAQSSVWFEEYLRRRRAVVQSLGLNPDDYAPEEDSATASTLRGAAAGAIVGGLMALARGRLLGGLDHVMPGEVTGVVPAGLVLSGIRIAEGRAHATLGATLDEFPLISIVPTGSTIEERLAGGEPEYTWVHGFYGEPNTVFEPHEALDGFTTTDPTSDPELLNDGDFPDAEYYQPSDHLGCSCEWEISAATEAGQMQLTPAEEQ